MADGRAGGGRRGRERAADGRALALLVLALAPLSGALLTYGGDTPLPSLLGGAALAGLGAVAAWRGGVPPVFWSGAALVAALGGLSAARGGLALAAPELGALAGAGGAFVVAASTGATTPTARRAAQILTWWLLAVLALAFVAHAADPDAVLGRPKPYHQGRLTGPFLSANTMATLSALALCLGIGGAVRAGAGAGGVLRWLDALGRRGLGAVLLALFALACLLLTGSRAGLAAGLVGAGWIALWQGRAAGRSFGGRLPTLLLLAAPVLLLVAVSGGVLGDRVLGVGTDGNGRLVLWRACLAAFAEAPLLGHGLGSFPRALAAQVTPETAPVLAVQNAAHSLPLQWLVQTGLLGTLGGLAVLVHLGLALRRGLRRRRGRAALRVGVVALGVVFLHGLADYALEVPALLWTLSLIVGLAAGTAGRTAGGRSAVRDRRAAPA